MEKKTRRQYAPEELGRNEVLVTGAFTPEKKLLDGPVIGGPGVRVADGNREELEELFGAWMDRRPR
jgi:hypothetical protein